MSEILIPEEYQEEKIYTDLFNAPEMIVLASFLSGKNLPYIEDLDPQDFTLAYETFKNIKEQYKKNKSIDQVKASKEGELKLQDINDLVKGYDNKLFLSCYKDLIMQK